MMREFVTRDGRKALLRPATEDDAAAFIRAVDGVAREQDYFIRSRFDVELEWERAFIAKATKQGNLMLLAVIDGSMVGWVTLLRARAEFMRHTADLGMGVIQEYRGIGVGTALLEYALTWAAGQGLEKIHLGVRVSNVRAQALYRKFGFVQEGYRVRAIKDTDGRYDDNLEMAYFISRVAGHRQQKQGED